MLVGVDAAGLEWRTLLLLSGDQVGIQEILSGEDTHAKNQELFKLPSRLIAKIFLFRTIYRGSGWAFAKDNDFKHVSEDPEFWDQKNFEFYNKYKGINECHHQWKARVMNKQKIVGPSGREWQIDIKPDGTPPWTTLTNYPVQGTGADLMSIARVSLRNRLRTLHLRSKLMSTVHDSLICDCPKDEVEVVAKTMKAVFDDNVKNMKKLWGMDSPIPFPGEIKIGTRLGSMEKYV